MVSLRQSNQIMSFTFIQPWPRPPRIHFSTPATEFGKIIFEVNIKDVGDIFATSIGLLQEFKTSHKICFAYSRLHFHYHLQFPFLCCQRLAITF